MPARLARPEDAAEIARIDRPDDAPSPWTRTTVEWMLEQGDDSLILVATDRAEVVGFLLGTAIADEGEILMMRVDAAHRRRGHARALLDAATTQWQRRRVTRAFLEVHVDNRGAQGLYRGKGWHEVGRRPRYYEDGGDALILRLDIPPA